MGSVASWSWARRRSPLLVHRRCWGCWQSQRSGRTGWARGGSARQPHTTRRSARRGQPPSPPALRAAAGSSCPARRLCVSSAFPLAWPESLNGSFGLRSAVQPTLSALCPVASPGLCRRALPGGQVERHWGRSAGSVHLLHFCRKLFLRVRVGVGVETEGGSRPELCFSLSRRAGFPGTSSPCRADSPAAGGSPSKRLLRARLGC